MLASTPALADGNDVAAYLRGRSASASGHIDIATADYARALTAAPHNPVVAIRAYRSALAAGDDALALRAAIVLDQAGVAPADTALIPLALAASANDPATADAAIARMKGTPLGLLVPALTQWTAFAKRAPASSASTATDPAARRFAVETRALLSIAGGHVDEGMTALTALGGAGAALDLRAAAARLLVGAGQGARARTLLTPEELALATPANPTLGFGVSWLLTRVAGELASAEPSPLSIALTRAALRADPTNDRARLLLALSLSSQAAQRAALIVLDGIAPTGPFGESAATARIVILGAAGRGAEALTIARTAAVRADSTANDWQRYGDLLAQAGREAEAAPWFRRLAERPGATWSDWLQYGGALDRAGRWTDAEPALERAVALGPDQSLALNYLGYARIEHNENATAATRLLARAWALKPDDDSIADSLGWAYFRSGDTARALPLVERAAIGEPTNAEIDEHLGDIYWSLGRHYEARYAWRAATVTAPATDETRLTGKIADGTPPRARH
ncbi:tetratricopeptide repeat protein [Sphingomonas bacterium]|uniref:tetratricopeptide repeat protein n=1 Tax=Sphingomonas bacterium TaxID=1895847 RepID=UPI001575EC5E|nr:tetratricopeptide repeat protein [Sphingomonas bacterium]